jgi:glycosyltransferase involved in cell wall biosynthesis
MNIIHVSPTYYSVDSVIGGGEKYIIYMIRAIAEAAKRQKINLDNSLLAFGDCPGCFSITGEIICNILSGVPWDIHSINLTDLLNTIDKFDILVVHQCLSAFGLFIASHARLLNKIVIGMDHGSGEHPLVAHSPEIGYIFDLCLTYSSFAASAFHDIAVTVKVIHGPVDTNYYIPSNLEDKDPFFVSAVGRLLPHKGFDRIINTLPQPLKLVIAGTRSNAEYLDYLNSLIQRSPCDISINEGLNDEEIRSLMRRSSLFIHASTHFDHEGVYYAKPELLGLAPLEALSCGTPVIVSNAGSLGELTSIYGCQKFSSDEHLKSLLHSHIESPTHKLFNPDMIHKSVKSLYGIEQFGDKLLAELNILRSTK